MLNHIRKFWPVLLIILPYSLVFKAFFLPGPLVWGDAPYFFPENLKDLFQKPLLWDFRNSNFGNSQGQVMWLYLPTFLMGLVSQLGLNHDIAIRLIFYFPSTLLALLGSWLLIKKFVPNNLVATLGSFLYTFNTYFLLLIDGGQIGLALSYGLFPLSLYALISLQEKFNTKNFFLATLTLFALLNTDLRVAVLLLLLYFLFNFKNFTLSIKTTFLPLLLSLTLSAFWVIPFMLTTAKFFTQELSQDLPANFLSFWNGLLLFNPHFPHNEFGKATPIPWYFYFLPLLFLSHVRLFALLLFFVLLISTPFGPLKQIYEFAVNNIPFAFAFRDTTKFFIPAILIASILLAKTANKLSLRFTIVIYFYLLILILPALGGQLSGVLAGKTSNKDFQIIYQNLKQDKEFFRTVWFSERPPFGFSSKSKEGLSASELYKGTPFAMMIEGTYDLFNFLHDKKLSSFFEVLGVKYAFFPPPPRQKIYTEEDIKNRQLFLEFIDSLGFKKLNWGTSFPVYRVANPRDKIYASDKIVFVVGDSSFYDNFDFKKAGVLFLEDGLVDLENLLSLPKQSALLYFHQSDRKDLIFTFLQKNFLKEKNLGYSQWGKYQGSQMLNWRYELLRRGIENFDFDFGQGIYFSSIKDEELRFKVHIQKKNQYFLAVRSLAATDSAGLKIDFAGQQKIISSRGQKFNWELMGPVDLNKGQYLINLKNLGSFQAVNVLALFSQEDLLRAKNLQQNLINKFYAADLSQVTSKDLHKINYQQINSTEYNLNLTDSNFKWIIFSDHFDRGWVLQDSSEGKSFPIYSLINGFWVDQKGTFKLYYQPQEWVDLGSKISLMSLGVFFAGLLLFKVKK